jgi:hypothetical protein
VNAILLSPGFVVLIFDCSNQPKGSEFVVNGGVGSGSGSTPDLCHQSIDYQHPALLRRSIVPNQNQRDQ